MERGEARETAVCFTCRFFFGCTGYYDYAQGYTPEFAGIDTFPGAISIRNIGRKASTMRASAWW